MNTVFLDTAFAISLSVKTDQFHLKSALLAEQLRLQKTKMLVTRGVLLEIGNSLSKIKYRAAALALLEALESDPDVQIVELVKSDYLAALELFRQRPDKDWGLVDCISFVVMKRFNIFDALTTDQHFVQAGFRALLQL